jgi:signal transduction histidine kinase
VDLGKEIDLTISDNGEGFDVKGRLRHGLGLISMRERIEHSGGSFSIESSRGKGATIRASWPI